MLKGTIKALLELYRDGGILICTSSDISGGPPGRNSGEIIARTLIQPDCDVVTKVSEGIFAQGGLWEKHLSSVRYMIREVRLLRRAVKGLQLVAVVPLLYGVQHFFALQIKVAVLSFLVSVMLIAFRPVVLFSFQRVLRRKFSS
jgi:hypothetical protein